MTGILADSASVDMVTALPFAVVGGYAVGEAVTLTLDGATLARWILDGPSGSRAMLNSILNAEATFSPDIAGTYVVKAYDSLGKLYTLDLHAAIGGSVGAALACRVTKSANQSLADGSLDAVSWDQEDYDNGGFHDALNNTRLTAPLTGKYHFTVVLAWNQEDTDGYRSLNYQVDGGGSVLSLATGVATVGTPMRLVGNLDLQMAAGQYIEFLGVQNSGSAVTIGGGAGSDTFASVYYLGA